MSSPYHHLCECVYKYICCYLFYSILILILIQQMVYLTRHFSFCRMYSVHCTPAYCRSSIQQYILRQHAHKPFITIICSSNPIKKNQNNRLIILYIRLIKRIAYVVNIKRQTHTHTHKSEKIQNHFLFSLQFHFNLIYLNH